MIESVDLSDTFSFTKKCNRDIILWLYIDRKKTVKLFSRIVWSLDRQFFKLWDSRHVVLVVLFCLTGGKKKERDESVCVSTCPALSRMMKRPF